MTEIDYSFLASVTGGPSLSASGAIDVGVYSMINVTAAAGDDVEADISPDALGKLLVITADSYEGITYQVTGGVTATLDGPHINLGAGAVGLLNGGDPVGTITFSNGGATDVTITIMLGRDAS